MLEIIVVRTEDELHYFAKSEFRGFSMSGDGGLSMYDVDDVGVEEQFVEPVMGGRSIQTGKGWLIKSLAVPVISYAAGYWLSVENRKIDPSQGLETKGARFFGSMEVLLEGGQS